MRGSGASRLSVAPGGALAGPWVRNPLWRNARAVPSLDLQFADNKSLVDGVTGQNLVTFTRASRATYTDSAGVLRSATTNLLTRSEEFGTTWTALNSSVSADATVAPNGASTADKIVENSINNVHGVSRSGGSESLVNGTVYTFSVYAKAAERSFVWMQALNSFAKSYFNLSTGVVSASGAGHTSTITAVGNGWYRCAITFTSDQTNNSYRAIGMAQVSGTESYAGDNTSGLFLWGAQLEQSSTVGEYIPTTSTINSAPRFDHNPTTGESLGVMVEEARTNSIIGSADFSSTYTALSNITTTVDTTVAPDGSTTGDTITGANSTLNLKYFYKQLSTTATGAYTASVYLKFNTQSIVLLRLNDNTGVNGVRQLINLSTGQLSGSVSIDGTATNPSSSITPVGNGWYRCTVTCTFNLAITTLQGPAVFHDGYTTSTSTNSYFVWGAQLEAGAFPTSYIPTTTATVTRAADVASITGSNFSSWYNSSASTIYSEAASSSGAAYNGYIYTIGADFNNSITHYRQSDFQPVARIRTASVDEYGAIGNGQIWTGTTTNKFALGVATTSGRQASNGQLTTGTDDTSITFPSVSFITIGALTGGTLPFNGTIKRLVYWGQRLPNSTLQAITQ